MQLKVGQASRLPRLHADKACDKEIKTNPTQCENVQTPGAGVPPAKPAVGISSNKGFRTSSLRGEAQRRYELFARTAVRAGQARRLPYVGLHRSDLVQNRRGQEIEPADLQFGQLHTEIDLQGAAF